MQAVLYDRWGGPEVLRLGEVPVPVPNRGEVLVRVRASSVNSWDWDLLVGKRYIVRPSGFAKGPKQLGFDVAGTIERLGPGASRFGIGDAVLGDLAFEGPRAFGEGALRPTIDSVYTLERIAQAFARFASGRFIGKIVVAVDPALA